MLRSSLLILCILMAPAIAPAQTEQANKTPPSKTVGSNDKAAKDLETERILRERRERAHSLLVSLAADAGKYHDQNLRARTQARIADAFWETDPDRSRTLFRKAWDAAEIGDAEGQQRLEEDIRQQQSKSGGGGWVAASPPELRNEVLRLVTRRDPTLAEEFIARRKAKELEAGGAKNPPPRPETDPAVSQRLGQALQLLAAGDTERAVHFAAPVLGTVTMQTIDFLSTLREKNATAADERYAAMLSIAAASPRSDANTASLLSSYIFTPHLYVTFSGSGSATSRRSSHTTPANVAPALRAAFFRSALEILMRPLPQPGPDQAASVMPRYLVIKRLAPLFEQFAPSDLNAALRAQLEAFFSMLSENQRKSQDETVREGILPQKPVTNREQSLLDQADRAKTSAERDQLFFQLALLKAEAGDLVARDYTQKIDDSELRKEVRAYIDATLAMRAVDKKDAERALEIARTGELTHLQRTWTLARAAGLLTKSDRDRALQILDDAMTEARRMDGSDPDRPRAFLAVANALFAIDRARGWDAVSDAVSAANSAPDFTGEDGQLTFRIITKGSRSVNQHSVPEFNLAGVFESLANDDYERAVDLARVFERDAPRAHAVIAIATAVLTTPKK